MKLVSGPGLDHATPLVSDVFQGGCDVDLLATLGHSVENHVDQNIRPGSAHTITENSSESSESCISLFAIGDLE